MCTIYYVLNKQVPVYLTLVNVHTLVRTGTGEGWQMCTHTWLYNVTYTWVPIRVFIQCHLAVLHTHQAWTIDSLHNDHVIISVQYYTTWCKV